MYVENVKDPVEFQPPSSDLLLVGPRMEEFGSIATSNLIDNLPLDLRDGPIIKSIANKPHKLGTANSTYPVNWFIALHTGWLRFLSLLPFIPRSSALQISAQDKPSST